MNPKTVASANEINEDDENVKSNDKTDMAHDSIASIADVSADTSGSGGSFYSNIAAQPHKENKNLIQSLYDLDEDVESYTE
jgi:hypothetical protein